MTTKSASPLQGIVRPRVPAMTKVVDYWATMPNAELEQVLPELRSHSIGWGEPFCFKCGWLAPVLDDDSAWRNSKGWLEVAHLADWCFTGHNEPSDCVPLCVLCHKSMLSYRDRDEALAWVAVPRHRTAAWQMLTDYMFEDCVKTGKFEGSKKAGINHADRVYESFMDESHVATQT